MGGGKDRANRFQIPGVECIIDIYINIDKKLNKNLQKHKRRKYITYAQE